MEFEYLHSFCNQPPGEAPSDPTPHVGTLEHTVGAGGVPSKPTSHVEALEHQEGCPPVPCRKWPRSLPGGGLWPFWSLTGVGGNS